MFYCIRVNKQVSIKYVHDYFYYTLFLITAIRRKFKVFFFFYPKTVFTRTLFESTESRVPRRHPVITTLTLHLLYNFVEHEFPSVVWTAIRFLAISHSYKIFFNRKTTRERLYALYFVYDLTGGHRTESRLATTQSPFRLTWIDFDRSMMTIGDR